MKRWLNSQLRSIAETPFPTLWLLSTLWWVNSKRRETTPEEFPGKKKGTCGQFGGGGGGKILARSEVPGKKRPGTIAGCSGCHRLLTPHADWW